MEVLSSTESRASGLPHFQLAIDGQRLEARSGRIFGAMDPYRGHAWATAADADVEDVDLAVAAARRALSGPWGSFTGLQRARLLRRLGDVVARDAAYLAELETRATGKLFREMRDQLAAIPEWFYYYAGLADKLEGATIPTDKPW
jgi:(Z)-2-((N-methylformamido)methylene)-5-hydroxybutyrolactone dehydrogenase